MGVGFILIVAIAAVALIKIFQELYKFYQFLSIVNKIPGPKAYPLIGNSLTFLRVTREERHNWQKQLSRQYDGGIYRFWIGTRPAINLTKAETLAPILSSRKIITKSKVYHFLGPWLGHGLLTSSGDLWHQQRKLVTPTLHFNILTEFATVMSQKAELLKEIIETKLKTNPDESIDMFQLMMRCALDIICESAMGININAQTDPQSEYSKALHGITIQTIQRAFRPWLHSDFVFFRTSDGKKFQDTVDTAHRFTNKVISERKLARKNQQNNLDTNMNTEKPKQKAFLDLLLDACERENMPLDDNQLREEVDTFLFAGHDTTATAMSWALLLISNNPEIEEKIHEEQLLVFGDSTEPATLQQISELKYLERVMKETLRMFPSVPILGRTVTEDVEIGGYMVPKGSLINIHTQEVHTDPNQWPNPEKFDPDRFLPENSNGRHPYAYVPFSAGPRNCLGQKFAAMEQKIVLTALLRKWRVKCLVKSEDALCYNELILRPQNGIHIYFTPK